MMMTRLLLLLPLYLAFFLLDITSPVPAAAAFSCTSSSNRQTSSWLRDGSSRVQLISSATTNANAHFRRRPFTTTCRSPAAAAGRASSLSSYSDGAVSTLDKPIVVIGAGGKTGRIITQLLADRGVHVRAVTRSGLRPSDDEPATKKGEEDYNDEFVSYVKGDVTNYESIHQVLQGQIMEGTSSDNKKGSGVAVAAGGVIFAATSSGKKGDSGVYDVDYMGAYNTAKACINCSKIPPRLVMISAGCVSRPNALGSRVVNKLTSFTYGSRCTWIDAKMAGETAVRNLYNKNKNDNKSLSYTIVRPAAALSNKPPIPVHELCVLQGDVYSSAVSISRTNVAELVVEILLSSRTKTDRTTLEVCPSKGLYKNEEGNILDVMGLPTFHQVNRLGLDLPQELVHYVGKDDTDGSSASSYSKLLNGLIPDDELYGSSYKSIVSDYRGLLGADDEDKQ